MDDLYDHSDLQFKLNLKGVKVEVLGNVGGYDVVMEEDLVILADPSSQVRLTFSELGQINGLVARAVKKAE